MTKVITISELVANIRCRRNGKTFLANFVNQCEFKDAIIIPPNATNGDVMRIAFPNLKELNMVVGNENEKNCVGFGTSCFSVDWWNAPYKGVNDESNN